MIALSMSRLKEEVINYDQGKEGLERWFLMALHEKIQRPRCNLAESVISLHGGLKGEINLQDVLSVPSEILFQAFYTATDYVSSLNESKDMHDFETKIMDVDRLRTKKLL